MEYALDRLRNQTRSILVEAGQVAPAYVNLSDPRPGTEADLAFPTFRAARNIEGTDPTDFASRLAASANVPSDSLVGKIDAIGPYVNIAVAPERYARAVISEVLSMGKDYGRDDVGNGQTVVVDMSAPNIARKMHIGHLRSTVIGNSIRRILQALGNTVVADNHLGDWGTQFGSMLAAYDLWGLPDSPDSDLVEGLSELYARFHHEAESDPSLPGLARDWFRRLEEGDKRAREIWRWMVDVTLQAFDETYSRLNVTFDTNHGESFYEPMLDRVVQEALDRGVASIEPDGSTSIAFDDMPSYLIRKSDGATLYQTRDLATCIFRWETYRPTRNIYVVGQEQRLHFEQIFVP